MENTLLKETFIPKPSILREDSIISLNSSLTNGHSIKYGIERDATNGLGYKPIRDPKKRIRSMKGLHKHLEEMTLIPLFQKLNFIVDNYEALLEYTNKKEKDYGLKEKEHEMFVNRLREELNEYGLELNQIRYVEKTVPYTLHLETIREKDRQIYNLKKKLSKKSLRERILG